MTPSGELMEILRQVRNHLLLQMELGMEPPPVSPLAFARAEEAPREAGSLEELRGVIGDCRRCKLWKERTRLVFGEGSPKARVVFVGEGPGREEDLEGRPFVGEAGRLLTRIVEAMGLTREAVYICNVVKCRPPGNRDPEEDEIKTCLPFLKTQLSLIKPEVICTLGRIAAGSLLGREFKITRERGEWLSYMGIPMMTTYHPAYVLRDLSRKRPVWEDVKKIMKRLGLEVKKND